MMTPTSPSNHTPVRIRVSKCQFQPFSRLYRWRAHAKLKECAPLHENTALSPKTPRKPEALPVRSALKRHRRNCLALLTCCLVIPALNTRAAFEDSLAGARSLAMGGAHVAISGATESLAANPAGLASLGDNNLKNELSASFGGLYLGLSDGNSLTQSYVAYATAPGPRTATGLAWKRFHGGGLYSEDWLAVGAATRISLPGANPDEPPRLAIGAEAALLKWDAAPTIGAAGNVLEDLTGPARISLSAGARYMLTASESVRVPFGLVFRHVNEPDVASESSTVAEPVRLQSAFGIGAITARTTWAVDIGMSRRSVDVKTGFEWEAHPQTLFLRFGFRLEGLALGTKVTFGAGLALQPTTRIDYAFWLPVGNVMETWGGHRIGVVYAF